MAMLMNFDKKGAEWVVVAYLTGDANMLQVIQEGKSPHVITGSLITKLPPELVEQENEVVGHHTDPDTIAELRREHLDFEIPDGAFLPRNMSIRQMGKKSNHALNYDEAADTFSLLNEVDILDAKKIVLLYKTQAYPGIPKWHKAIQQELRESGRILEDCFGNRVRLLGPFGPDLFRSAYSFKPQSTVVYNVNTGMAKAYADQTRTFQLADLLTQVHDSLLWQYPEKDMKRAADFAIRMAEYMSPVCCYNEREFTIGTELKIGRAWSEKGMIDVPIVSDIDEQANLLAEGWARAISHS